MLNFEQYPQSFDAQFPYHQDERKREQYLPTMMDSFPEYNSMPINAAMFADGHQEFKYEMLRTMSENSMQQTNPNAAPSLHSSASLPSASSSTVGSPYSGHAQPVSNQMMYSASQYHSNPTIVYDDQFPHAFESAHFDLEAHFGQHESKLTGPFVGKCADLSTFVKRSSTLPARELLSPVTLVSSPTPISDLDERVPAFPPKRDRSGDDAARVAVTPTTSISQPKDNTIFKSPTTPASAYPRAPSVSSPTARRTTFFQQPTPHSQGIEQPFSCLPISLTPPMQQYGGGAQFNFFSQTSGNFIPPIEASCSSVQRSFFYIPTSLLHRHHTQECVRSQANNMLQIQC